MHSITKRYLNLLQSKRAGLALFSLFVLVTALALLVPQLGLGNATPSFAAPLPITAAIPAAPEGAPLVKVTLSQQTLVQSIAGALYAEIVLEVPKMPEQISARQPIDMVLVLDRSGSMAAQNKLPLAKKAIAELISRLNPEDRFALVSFDNNASVNSPLSPVTPESQASVREIVAGLNPGGATNISGGLELARSLLRGSNRQGRVLLLSDGEANNGITDPAALAKLGATISATSSSVLSTVGLGLGFNETLLASLADFGMGSYAYLETLEGLDTILVRELNDGRNVYARQSELEITLSDGVRLVDAGGYPMQSGTAGTLHIPSGQLLSGSRKSFFLSLQLPAYGAGEHAIGNVRVSYDRGRGTEKIEVPALLVRVVPEAMREEAVASINNDVFKKNWMQNKVGMLQRDLSSWLRKGDKDGANKAIADFERETEAASAEAPALRSEILSNAKLKSAEMKEKVGAAFSGAPADQLRQQNRAAKQAMFDGYESQRSAR